MLMPRRHGGFTLLEVLISGFILFLALTAMSEVYRGALLSSIKAESALQISSAVPSIHSNIVEVMRENSNSDLRYGEGKFGHLEYSWKAMPIYEGEPSQFLQEDYGDEIRYFLWQIDLEVTNKTQTRGYSFLEVSW